MIYCEYLGADAEPESDVLGGVAGLRLRKYFMFVPAEESVTLKT